MTTIYNDENWKPTEQQKFSEYMKKLRENPRISNKADDDFECDSNDEDYEVKSDYEKEIEKWMKEEQPRSKFRDNLADYIKNGEYMKDLEKYGMPSDLQEPGELRFTKDMMQEKMNYQGVEPDLTSFGPGGAQGHSSWSQDSMQGGGEGFQGYADTGRKPHDFDGKEDVGISIISRDMWKALPPKDKEPLKVPVNHVRYTYEDIDKYGGDLESSLKACQRHYMDQGYSDIPYNFIVGVGFVVEGRGWEVQADRHVDEDNPHCPQGGWMPCREQCLDICLMGNYAKVDPPLHQLTTGMALIKLGVQKKMIYPDFNFTPIHNVLTPEKVSIPGECPDQ